MRASTLSQRLGEALGGFAWDEWAQMGVPATPQRLSPWAQDPEALVLFTLEVGRDDPRLFDALLDWLVVNEPLLNLRRLKAMCNGPEDERLIRAVLIWVDQHRRSKPVPVFENEEHGLELLFRGLLTAVAEPDPAFAAAGLLRPTVTPAGQAAAPDMLAPIDFAFRLRQLLGVSARSEAVRYLLTAPTPADVAAITRSAGFARRNVREALLSLQDAGVVSQRGKRRFDTDRGGWMRLLRIDDGGLPEHRAWPQILGGLRAAARWLRRDELHGLSEYMLGSEARDLLEAVRDDFEEAGFDVGRSRGAAAFADLESLIDDVLASLRVGWTEQPSS